MYSEITTDVLINCLICVPITVLILKATNSGARDPVEVIASRAIAFCTGCEGLTVISHKRTEPMQDTKMISAIQEERDGAVAAHKVDVHAAITLTSGLASLPLGSPNWEIRFR